MRDAIQAFGAVLVGTLGGAPDAIEPGQLQRFGTNGKRGEKAGWCLLFSDLRAGVFGCHRQGISETWTALDRHDMTLAERAELARQVAHNTAERQQQQRQRWARNSTHIARLWAECQPIQQGDPVTLYLERRGLGHARSLPACLRLHPSMSYWQEGRDFGRFPAMVAPIVEPTGRLLALHRTYLTHDGRKAEVPVVKKLTNVASPLSGACIPLGQPTHGVIGIAEGIETALASWAASGVPTVAAYCANGLASWSWPANVLRLIIFADHDPAGLHAADVLSFRARQAGLRCEVLSPSKPGSDWCDVWQQRHREPALEGGAA